MLNSFDTSGDYMYPAFDITIDRVFANFYYSFSVFADSHGDINYDKPLIPFSGKGYEENDTLLSKVVMDRYFKSI